MLISLFIIFLSFFVSCGGASHDNHTHEARPPRVVKSIVVSSTEYVERSFAGLSTPEVKVDLAFKVSGQIISIPVITGEEVDKGDVLAQIDPRDLELATSADRSTYEEAKSSYERSVRLLAHEAISRQEAERAESAYVRSRSAYENSLELLDQTTLRAPFGAVVESIGGMEYQRVQAGESVMRIVSPTTNQVSFTLPESMLSVIGDSTTRFSVVFDNYMGERFDARVIESARSSSDASGFPVVLRFENPAPSRFYINPGLSCSVDMRSREHEHDSVVVPLSAIYSPIEGGTYVWVVDNEQRVDLREVVLGSPVGVDYVMVSSGLGSGERVVVAGVYQLVDNQRVKIV